MGFGAGFREAVTRSGIYCAKIHADFPPRKPCELTVARLVISLKR